MKTPIAVTLIIMGALLVMTPALSDYLYQRNVVSLLSQSNFERVSLAGQMSGPYRLGCWLTGSGMIAVAVICSISARRQSEDHPAIATQAG